MTKIPLEYLKLYRCIIRSYLKRRRPSLARPVRIPRACEEYDIHIDVDGNKVIVILII